jgi:hypothetical protein
MPAILTASVWRDGERLPAQVKLEDGVFRATLSPKGITSLVIDGLEPAVSFQNKLNAKRAPAGAVTHRRVQTPFGEVEAMVLSFGPELTWLYTYLTAEPGQVQSARMRVALPDRTESLADEEYPFEFTMPLKPGEKTLELSIEAINAAGQQQSGPPIHLDTP